jgi:hypothetical protein
MSDGVFAKGRWPRFYCANVPRDFDWPQAGMIVV